MSPNVCRSNAAYAVAGLWRLASTQLVQTSCGRPATFLRRLFQVFPPSRVSWRLPSSVPAQMTLAVFGDSLIAKIVQWFSALELSTERPPDSSWFSFAGSFVVRSGEIRVQVSPRSDERKRNCEPTY